MDYLLNFLINDALFNFDSIVFSTLNPPFYDEGSLKNFVIQEKYNEKLYNSSIFNFLNLFEEIVTLDNLDLLFKKYPKCYNFYEINSQNFYIKLYSFKTLISNLKHILTLNFKGVKTISVSEIEFLNNFKLIYDLSEKIHNKYGKINELNIILNSTKNNSKKLKALLNEISIFFDFYEYHIVGSKIKYTDVFPKKHECYYIENDIYVNILNGSPYISGNYYYFSINEIHNNMPIIINFNKINLYNLFLTSLNIKINWYKKFLKLNFDGDDVVLKKYFKVVVDKIKVNDNFNFIPGILFNNFQNGGNKIKKWFLKNNWIENNLGLINLNIDKENVIPIFEFI